jgi:anti-anti-sigma factor
MLIETYDVGKFQILRIKEKKNAIRNLEELKDLIIGYLERGKYYIALSFSDATYIYSGAIKVLITCHKMIREKGGELCIIEPDPSLFDILENLNIDRVINIYVSEKYLPA